jgi:hypothetical protein
MLTSSSIDSSWSPGCGSSLSSENVYIKEFMGLHVDFSAGLD